MFWHILVILYWVFMGSILALTIGLLFTIRETYRHPFLDGAEMRVFIVETMNALTGQQSPPLPPPLLTACFMCRHPPDHWRHKPRKYYPWDRLVGIHKP